MSSSRAQPTSFYAKDYSIGAGIFIVTLIIFTLSPVRIMTDSNFSMLLSENLLRHHTFELDNYKVIEYERKPDGRLSKVWDYHLEEINNHTFYFLPVGTSILSVPHVAIMNALGVSAANPDGTYSRHNELIIQSRLAAILMALLAAIFFFTGRLLLSISWSLLIALGGALGTQVWSTASRVMWNDTWAILLLGLALFMLIAQRTGRHKLSPVLFATILSWTYFVRPTNAVTIIAITIYLFICHRNLLIPFLITGALWLAAFIFYSWHYFHSLLPSYYEASRLRYNEFWTALPGNLISPSRGLFVFVPVLFFVIYLLLRYRRELNFPALIITALSVCVVHVIASSGFVPWHGGGCYGPRYTTGIVPWFILLAILGIAAMLAWREKNAQRVSIFRWRGQLAIGAALLMISVFINARGALAWDTWRWNGWPVSVDFDPARVWDWRYPQFLAGLIHPPLPQKFPAVEVDSRIDFTRKSADPFLWYGWSHEEGEYRWSDGREAALIFGLNRTSDLTLKIRTGAFLAQGKLFQQRVLFFLNGQKVGTLWLRNEAASENTIALPGNLLKQNNILVLKLPDADAPDQIEDSPEQRQLALRVEWIQIEESRSGQ
ncbi:MAG: hypothetical protein AUG51_09815 [Acidobacteria bacterium 13_1_20CM_3_53_8]|nr:MAG: hypothetical protein AUG51_09815 [Acidobacteria bacterium 13_1_20CM_3_53_8]